MATLIKRPVVISNTGKNPMISEKGISLLNYRIEQEEFSSRLYLSMSMWLTNTGYLGSGKLWLRYSKEENDHADWARTYLLSMGVQPLTPALKDPGQIYTGLPEIVKLSYNHEIEVTKQCTELAKQSMQSGDIMMYELALKYLHEQVEEHDKLQNWMDRLSAFGTEPILLRELDEEMGES